jgi:hypothetical protein
MYGQTARARANIAIHVYIMMFAARAPVLNLLGAAADMTLFIIA